MNLKEIKVYSCLSCPLRRFDPLFKTFSCSHEDNPNKSTNEEEFFEHCPLKKQDAILRYKGVGKKGVADHSVSFIIGHLYRHSESQNIMLNRAEVTRFIDPQYIGREFINDTQDTVFTLLSMGIDPQGGKYIEFSGSIRPHMIFWLKVK